jgi:hypothetical protein
MRSSCAVGESHGGAPSCHERNTMIATAGCHLRWKCATRLTNPINLKQEAARHHTSHVTAHPPRRRLLERFNTYKSDTFPPNPSPDDSPPASAQVPPHVGSRVAEGGLQRPDGTTGRVKRKGRGTEAQLLHAWRAPLTVSGDRRLMARRRCDCVEIFSACRERNELP